MRADEAVVPDADVPIDFVNVVVRQDGGAECDDGVRADVNAFGIRQVELRTHGNRCSFPDLHLPDLHQVLPAECNHDFAQPVAYLRR